MISSTEDLKRRREDMIDQQNEIAGRDAGRQQRFTASSVRSAGPEAKERDARAVQTQLDLMLQDATYRAAHERVTRRLQEAQNRLDAQLDQVAEMQADTQAEIDAMERKAARLPDGSMVFRDKSGAVRRADGSEVDPALAATILWTGDEPSYEEWQAAQDRLARLQEREQAIRAQQQRIGELQDRVEDPDNPPSEAELDDIEAEADAILSDLDADLDALALPSTSPDASNAAEANPLAAPPTLGG